MISWFEKHNKISLLITVLIAITIFLVSSISFKPGPSGFAIKSIAYHFLIYFLLSLFLIISIIRGKLPVNYRILLILVISSILYGISDEIHQLFVPGRYGSIEDVLTDSAGVLFACLFYCSYCLVKEK